MVSVEYVDHELSTNLDSTNAFEGPEKLLEIWFWKSEFDLPSGAAIDGMRSVPMSTWVDILDLVSCKILSMKSCKFMDAYLLSESSLFVFPHKIILKTCGTTTTLACLDKLFQATKMLLGISSKQIYRVFYSRRSFMFPEKQVHVHRDWKSEVALLNEHFVSGKSYVVGDFASDDHWYLYVGGNANPSGCQTSGLHPNGSHPNGSHPNGSLSDQTFEILMTELDPKCASTFIYLRQPGGEKDLGHELGFETMVETELDTIFQSPTVNTHLPSPSISEDEHESVVPKRSHVYEFIHDSFAFTPCGFSSNSICTNIGGGYYYTLHITPESGWSYASFETNYPFNETVDVITVLTKVLKTFHPKKFSMTLISEVGDDERQSTSQALLHCDLSELNYKRAEKAIYDLNEYSLLYMNFNTEK
ncbi:SPE2 [Candida oxycetoniae]|uniref:adenosylmethionine decarboxylase n=1 Tax=Candida oxycetoniae TaxID=497107 RepID=A0AAI9SYL6_9ASCO|nr:SPE2 [Candida oxycetoniae]KAI3404900.2 SPE2 [Candida oxycetoniae]